MAASCPSVRNESDTRTENEHVGEGNMSFLFLGLGSVAWIRRYRHSKVLLVLET